MSQKKKLWIYQIIVGVIFWFFFFKTCDAFQDANWTLFWPVLIGTVVFSVLNFWKLVHDLWELIRIFKEEMSEFDDEDEDDDSIEESDHEIN